MKLHLILGNGQAQQCLAMIQIRYAGQSKYLDKMPSLLLKTLSNNKNKKRPENLGKINSQEGQRRLKRLDKNSYWNKNNREDRF